MSDQRNLFPSFFILSSLFHRFFSSGVMVSNDRQYAQDIFYSTQNTHTNTQCLIGRHLETKAIPFISMSFNEI